MRVLMISDVYFPRINGVSTSIRTFRQELHARGHEVVLIAPDYGSNPGDDESIIRVPSRRVVLDPEDRMLRPAAVRRLAGSLARSHFDVLHIQTPFVAHYLGLYLSRRLGLPRIESYHTFFEEYLHCYVPFLPRGLLRFAARRFTASQCNNVDAVIVPSSAMLSVLRDYGVRAPASVIPTGIDLPLFHSGNGARFRARYGIPAARPVLTHIGRVAFEKNIDFLLRMLVRVREKIPDVLLIIAGEGPALEHLRRLAVQLGISDNVFFVGYLDRERELLDCYLAGDAFVFASRTETQGLVLLEAMALGVPVVSTAVMGTRDILRARRGAVVAPEDADGFAQEVCALLGDPLRSAALGRDGQAFVREWSAESLALRLLDFYRDVATASVGGVRAAAHQSVAPIANMLNHGEHREHGENEIRKPNHRAHGGHRDFRF